MSVASLAAGTDAAIDGDAMHALMVELFPICRSITGEGLRRTLARIDEVVPLDITEVPTGTPVFDWTIPNEWNIQDAWVADAAGRRVIDFQASNLHVVHYSVPVRERLSLAELRAHLHTIPQRPTWVPYKTSFYAENWGFCLSQEALDALPEGEYEAVIESTLADGSLTYGELVLPGATDREILVSSHVCHPSLANDNLSGVVVATRLAQLLAGVDHHFTYRFVFAPGTIGAIAWLAANEERLGRLAAGLVLACVGDDGAVVYKRSRQGDTWVDRAGAHVLGHHPNAEVVPFTPYGNDERQFCSPGIDLPVGAVTRSGHDRSDRHHTSADDLESVSQVALTDTLRTTLQILSVLECDAVLENLSPKGEPQLGRRGLFRAFGGRTEQAALESALLWVLSLGDRRHSELDVAERSGLPFAVVHEAALALEEAGLVRRHPVTELARGAES